MLSGISVPPWEILEKQQELMHTSPLIQYNSKVLLLVSLWVSLGQKMTCRQLLPPCSQKVCKIPEPVAAARCGRVGPGHHDGDTPRCGGHLRGWEHPSQMNEPDLRGSHRRGTSSTQGGPQGKLVAALRCRRQARRRGKPRGSARRRAVPSRQPARLRHAPVEDDRRAEKERAELPPRSEALGSALSQPQPPPVSERGEPQRLRQGFYRKWPGGRCNDLDRTTGRRRSSAVGRGSSSPPPPEVGLGGAVGQWRHFLAVAASRGRARLAGAVEGRPAGRPARLEMTDALLPRGCQAAEPAGDGYFRKGCNPLAETGRSKLQNQRAVLNQQILRAVRMRAGAENLLRATTNNKVREQVLLELSFVNSDLQILKEELEGLNISVEVYQNAEETFSIPLVPLGLKETKDVDFTLPLKDFILEHYSEDSSEYEDEIADLMDLRQACRTPSRDEAGIEMLISYFLQLGYIENRFFPPTRHIGVLFTWYDSFTGVPVCQQNLLLEKASVLFNIGALYTQIATRCNRQTQAGLENAVDAFQKAAGVLSYLKETFTHTPSYDMSPAMLNVLVKMMLAQAQECVFEQIGLSGIRNEFFTLVKMTQEVAKVGEVYMLVNIAMSQEPVKENIPYSWSKLAQIKSDHYKALAHYFIATILCDHELQPSDDKDQQEKALSQLYDYVPEGLMVLAVLKDKVQRKQLGKAHLRKAIAYHEEALRVCGLCKKLRNIEVLQEVLTAAHKRSLLKYAQQETEDDFLSLIQAPDILPKTEHKIGTIAPQFSKVKVKDFFHKLGPLTVFSAKQRWTAPRTIRLHNEAGELGFSLKGGSPVQVYCLDPVCSAASAGLKEGDYIVSIGGMDCKWLGVNEVLEKLKSVGKQPMEFDVISCQDTAASLHSKSATYSMGMQKTYSLICLAMDEDKIDQTKKAPLKLPFLSWGTKNRQKAASTLCLPSAVAGSSQIKKKLSPFTLLNTESSLY